MNVTYKYDTPEQILEFKYKNNEFRWFWLSSSSLHVAQSNVVDRDGRITTGFGTAPKPRPVLYLNKL